MELSGIAISALALFISIGTAWLTLFRRGKLTMTRPTMIALVFEGLEKTPKVVLRSCLYSTGHRGIVIESMVARMTANNQEYALSFWAYTPDNNVPAIRGGGLRADINGVSLYHHFLPLPSTNDVRFSPGRYAVDVSAWIAGRKDEVQLGKYLFNLNAACADALERRVSGAMCDWNPVQGCYEVSNSRPIV
jgi:hypothetical protein